MRGGVATDAVQMVVAAKVLAAAEGAVAGVGRTVVAVEGMEMVEVALAAAVTAVDIEEVEQVVADAMVAPTVAGAMGWGEMAEMREALAEVEVQAGMREAVDNSEAMPEVSKVVEVRVGVGQVVEVRAVEAMVAVATAVAGMEAMRSAPRRHNHCSRCQADSCCMQSRGRRRRKCHPTHNQAVQRIRWSICKPAPVVEGSAVRREEGGMEVEMEEATEEGETAVAEKVAETSAVLQEVWMGEAGRADGEGGGGEGGGAGRRRGRRW